ncbi:MAG: 2-hydroxyacyl-CoA dehydratase [Planctomycetes bacterium]|nr:2-hydroxyacyl-CoA dehydratase [Planctomycetota bacterium]
MSKTVKRVEIRAQQQLRTLMRDYFVNLDAAAADPDRRVAWCSSVGPCEILTAFGFETYFPENHGAMLGARKVSHKYIPHAVGEGYCAESCSYMTSDIGSELAGYSPLQEAFGISGRPKPDVLVYSTNQCREVQDWWHFFGRRNGAPVLGICPPTHLGEVTDEQVMFVRGELVRLIEQIETEFDLKLDMSRLEQAVTLSSRASTLWRQVLDTARSHPAALTFWDGLIHMAPVILMRGSQTAIDYYEALLVELRERERDGVGAIPEERYRLYWEGMPVWPKVRELSEKCFDLRAVIAASTYCNSWAFEDLMAATRWPGWRGPASRSSSTAMKHSKNHSSPRCSIASRLTARFSITPALVQTTRILASAWPSGCAIDTASWFWSSTAT